jgi:hypothetical protein
VLVVVMAVTVELLVVQHQVAAVQEALLQQAHLGLQILVAAAAAVV